MDGTLISTEAVIVHCVNETSKKYLKRALPAGDAFWTLGPPARNIIEGFADSLPGKPVREAVDDYLFCYRNNLLDKATLFPGNPEATPEAPCIRQTSRGRDRRTKGTHGVQPRDSRFERLLRYSSFS